MRIEHSHERSRQTTKAISHSSSTHSNQYSNTIDQTEERSTCSDQEFDSRVGIVCQLQLPEGRNGDWIRRRKYLSRSLWPSRSHVRIIEKSINIDMNVRTLEVVTSSAWIMLEWLMLRSKEMKAGLSITRAIQTVKSVKFELIMKTSWFSLLAVIFMLEMKSRMITNSHMKRMRLGVCVVLRIAELEWISELWWWLYLIVYCLVCVCWNKEDN